MAESTLLLHNISHDDCCARSTFRGDGCHHPSRASAAPMFASNAITINVLGPFAVLEDNISNPQDRGKAISIDAMMVVSKTSTSRMLSRVVNQ
jgi:hypothetical protein